MLLTLTLIHPKSNWTQWATIQCHQHLPRAATSASSKLSTIFYRGLCWPCSTSLFTATLTLYHFPILLPPSTTLEIICNTNKVNPQTKSVTYHNWSRMRTWEWCRITWKVLGIVRNISEKSGVLSVNRAISTAWAAYKFAGTRHTQTETHMQWGNTA